MGDVVRRLRTIRSAFPESLEKKGIGRREGKSTEEKWTKGGGGSRTSSEEEWIRHGPKEKPKTIEKEELISDGELKTGGDKGRNAAPCPQSTSRRCWTVLGQVFLARVKFQKGI